jgi:hypothetical protein
MAVGVSGYNTGMNAELAEWLAGRPESVKRLADEFPLQTVLELADGPVYVMGWAEPDSLVVTPHDPAADYDNAWMTRGHVPAANFRT